jgi:hypothetical protein
VEAEGRFGSLLLSSEQSEGSRGESTGMLWGDSLTGKVRVRVKDRSF